MTQYDDLLATYPAAPIDAWQPGDWREVPKGFYAVPIWDWTRWSGELTEDNDPALELIGFQFAQRSESRVYKTGKKAGQRYGKDELKAGKYVAAPGATGYIERRGLPDERTISVWERLGREVTSYRHGISHELVDELPAGTSLCRCCGNCLWSARRFPEHMAYIRTPNARTAYVDALAAAIIDSIEKRDDVFRKIYGQLTGNCGCCGKVLTDAKSKFIGIGPDCRGYR